MARYSVVSGIVREVRPGLGMALAAPDTQALFKAVLFLFTLVMAISSHIWPGESTLHSALSLRVQVATVTEKIDGADLDGRNREA